MTITVNRRENPHGIKPMHDTNEGVTVTIQGNGLFYLSDEFFADLAHAEQNGEYIVTTEFGFPTSVCHIYDANTLM